MKRLIATTLIILSCITHLEAQIPRTLSYQGILSDTSGTVKPDGVYGMTFRLYAGPLGGEPLWTETRGVHTRRGLFNAVIGDVTPFPESLPFDRQYWLSIQISPEPELTPRIQLTASGYSLYAARADTAQYARHAPGAAVADSARIAGTVSDNSLTGTKIAAGQVVKSLNGLRDGITLRGQGAATVTSQGDTITISTPPPSGGTGVQSLQNTNNSIDILNPTGPNVTANVKVPLSMTASTASGGSSILSATNTGMTGTVHGLAGKTSSTTTFASGVYGEGLATSGFTVGVLGYGTQSPNGAGVAGFGNLNGVYGFTTSGLGGVVGRSENTVGVRGESSTNFGVYGNGATGVYGQGGSHGGSFSGSSFGVYGLSSAGTGIFGQGGTHGGSFVGSDFGVYGSGTAYGIGVYGISSHGVGLFGTSTNGAGIEGISTGAYTSGVSGRNDAASGVGVAGSSTNGDGVFGSSEAANKSGVWGRNNVSNGVGVAGSSTEGTGILGTSTLGFGVKGMSTVSPGVFGESTNGNGVYGTSTNENGTVGYASANHRSGVVGYHQSGALGALGSTQWISTYTMRAGVFGDSGPGDSGSGVIGVGHPGIANYAGRFFGTVFVDGVLNATDKHFYIDHPLDPANRYLAHSCVESNDRMNIYNGNITTDGSGSATIELPSYFKALNVDYRYQLTVIGQFAQAIVSSEITDNQFSIKTDKPHVKVSWQVSGIRNDVYARAHPMQVEVEKPAHEKGTYTYPELFGLPPRPIGMRPDKPDNPPQGSASNK